MAHTEEGNLYVDITELRMDQVLEEQHQIDMLRILITNHYGTFLYLTCVLGNVNFDPTQTYITYYHNWLRMAVIGILPFSAICCLNLRIFLAVS